MFRRFLITSLLLSAPLTVAAQVTVAPVDLSIDHVRGDPSAPISLIEYGDFECPFCRRLHPTMHTILDEYGNNVRWVFRNFPLSIHPRAFVAAQGAECAAVQGGEGEYWRYNDFLYNGNKDRGKESLILYAKQLGFNATEFRECLDSGQTEERVRRDMASGKKAGVSGTPGTIIVNNLTGKAWRVSGAQPLDFWQKTLNEIMKIQNPAGIKGTFLDVSPVSGVNVAVSFLAAHNIVGGYDDGTFRPGNTVNRAEAAKMLMLARFGEVPEASEDDKAAFKDLDPEAWYIDSIAFAASQGVIKGHPDGTFRPEETVNTAEFLKMLSIAFNISDEFQHTYSDVPLDAWYAQYAGLAEQHNLFPERNLKKLISSRPLTRGEIVVAIYQLIKN